VLINLPGQTLAAIDEIKQRLGLPSRSLVLLQLIERGMKAAQ
jgi:metal-responsive CopG/Arc/MetJ family transcriptional regulator